MVSIFWVLVTKAYWICWKHQSVLTNFLYCLLMGQLLRNQYTTGPGDYSQQATPAVYVDMCNDSLKHGTNNNWWHKLLHLGTLYSNRISPLLELMYSPIPNDCSHQVTYEAWLDDILWGAPTGVTLHCWWCISNVTHPVPSPVKLG